jgi:hypothetical protein
VFGLGEANLGVAAVRDPVHCRNVYAALEPEKYYANGGGGSRLRALAVRAGERLIALVLNPEPVAVKAAGFDVSPLGGTYATAVVRETSLARRDEAVARFPAAGGRVALDLPPESLTQLIFVKEDLSRVEELKIEETTATPGGSHALGTLETTRLRALGRVGTEWLDLTELDVIWSSSEPDTVSVGQGGLVQRVREGGGTATVTARTPGGIEAKRQVRGQAR